jgi:hypothetical protein
MSLDTQSEFAMLDETQAGDAERDSSKESAMTTCLEMACAIAGLSALLAIAGWVWYFWNPEWLSSIHRFQEMI